MGEITRERLHELFDVDAESGVLRWRTAPRCHSELLGQEAGSPRQNHSGKIYWHVKIGGRAYKRSHLIYLAVHGKWPAPCVDHVDGNSENDRGENLRQATATENAWNHKRRARRIDLPMGVRVVASSGRFAARITYNKQQIHLGAYATADEASAVYQAKRRELYGEFA